MNDLVYSIACAIAAQEGYFEPGTLAADNNNPGNLRSAVWLPNSKIVNGYWQAPSIEAGLAGLQHLIALRISEGYTLAQLISSWAPASDGNQPSVYMANVLTWTGIPDATVPLWNYLEPLTDPRKAIS